MLGHSAISDAPISALAEEFVPPTPVFMAVRRFIRTSFLGISPTMLRGKVTWRGVSPDDAAPVPGAYLNVRRFIHFSPAHMPVEIFRGKVTWRFGVSEDINPSGFRIPQVLRRLNRGHTPHPRQLTGRVRWRPGVSPPWVEFTQVYEQGYRVADDGLNVYELFVGEDGPPDFTAPPEATSPTLPFSWSPTPPGTGTLDLHIVVRKRNKYDLQSFNVYETIKTIDTLGAEQPEPVSAPMDVRVYDGATGYIQVISKYLSSDDPQPADTWDVWVKIGSNPVIGVDAVSFTGAMSFFGVEAGLSRTFGPYSPGTVAHVLVSARRDSDDVRASAAIVLHTLAEALELMDGSLFGGEVYEQE